MPEHTIDLRDVYEQRFQSIDSKLDDIGNALVTLAHIDERQIAISENLVKVIDTQQSHGDRLATLEKAIPNELDKRLGAIETVMPGLKETRGWVVAGVLAGVAVLGTALAATVLK